MYSSTTFVPVLNVTNYRFIYVKNEMSGPGVSTLQACGPNLAAISILFYFFYSQLVKNIFPLYIFKWFYFKQLYKYNSYTSAYIILYKYLHNTLDLAPRPVKPKTFTFWHFKKWCSDPCSKPLISLSEFVVCCCCCL